MQLIDVDAPCVPTFLYEKRGVIIEQKKQFEATIEAGGIPGFRSENRTYQLLNLGLDVEADGVIYHLSSEFAGNDELGAVIDLIELERNRRNSA